MRIAVIGTGHVGGALGTGWARAGHDVIFGARDPKAADAQLLLSKAAGKAKLASIADAVAGAEVVVRQSSAQRWPTHCGKLVQSFREKS